ncbi:MAG TPA: hypothetical protein VMG08_06465 [Allosphingosinicella sp.]|nr:hypothetical protein [Allosphingosinicella sp.]
MTTTIPERVNALITHSAGAQCDRCIQEALGLAQNNQVQQITSALATTCEFVREKAPCAGCGKAKVVTRRASLPAAALLAVAA